MTETNIIYLPASRDLWENIALELDTVGLKPAIWFGDWRYDNFARKNFPDATVLPIKAFHVEMNDEEVQHVPNAEYLRSRSYIQMKNQAMKLMDRQDEARTFGRLERESYFYSMFSRLYSLIIEKNIGALVMGEAPHATGHLIAYRICESLGIPTYHLVTNSYVPMVQVNTSIVGKPIPVVGEPDVAAHVKVIREAFEAYKKGIPTPLYMTNQATFDEQYSSLKMILKYWRHLLGSRIRPKLGHVYRENNDYHIRSRFPHEVNQKKWETPFRIEQLRKSLENEYRKFAVEVNVKDSKASKYVYFPMPYEPERTSNPDGGDFYEAIDALLALREFVPENIHIYVKEHPSQFSKRLVGYKGRSSKIYQVLRTLKNVTLVSMSTPSAQLIENSEFVCCITGTAALESALIGRKGVVFGTPWFFELPGVFHFDNLKSYSELINAPTFTLEQVISEAERLLPIYAIPGCPWLSQERYFKQKFGESFETLAPDPITVKYVVGTISSHFRALRK